MKSSAHGLESDGYVTTRDRDTARDSESDDVVSEWHSKITLGRSNVETGTSRRARTVPPTGSDSDESEDSVKQVRSTVWVIPGGDTHGRGRDKASDRAQNSDQRAVQFISNDRDKTSEDRRNDTDAERISSRDDSSHDRRKNRRKNSNERNKRDKQRKTVDQVKSNDNTTRRRKKRGVDDSSGDSSSGERDRRENRTYDGVRGRRRNSSISSDNESSDRVKGSRAGKNIGRTKPHKRIERCHKNVTDSDNDTSDDNRNRQNGRKNKNEAKHHEVARGSSQFMKPDK